MPRNPMRLITVYWDDSHSGRGWRPLADIRECAEVLECQSVGWIVADTKKVILLASSLSGDGERIGQQGCGDIAIPKKSIRFVVEHTAGRRVKR